MLDARNADGGWGYYPGKSSRLEPTALAALALTIESREHDFQVLERWPSRDDLLLERAGGDPNYGFHGLALLAMQGCQVTHAAGTMPLLRALERAGGLRLDAATTSGHQDNALQGWSWIPETFSWVEPTAWSLLALKKCAPAHGAIVDDGRISEAERMLINRCCVDGGWNYGNADVLGTNLRAYVPTTAAALLAMQDRRDLDVVARSLAYLREHATAERSGTALALAMIALGLYGCDQSAARSALLEQLPITRALGNCAAIALAAYALDPGQPYAALSL